MAQMSTTLKENTTSGNARTFSTTGHSFETQRLVVQTRKIPTGNELVGENTIIVKHSTQNSAGERLAPIIRMSASTRIPRDGTEADVDAALVIFRDIVNSDEFALAVKTGDFVNEYVAP